MESFLKDSIFYLIVSALVFLHIIYWPGFVFGVLLLFAYLLYISRSARVVLSKIFFLSSKAHRIRVLGAFFALATLSLISGLAIIFYKLSPLLIALSFLFNGLLFTFLEIWAGPLAETPAEMYDPKMQVLEEMPMPALSFTVYLILFFYGLFLLYRSQTGAPVLTPWQTIADNYIYVFAAATLLLGFLVFSNLKSKTILFLIVAHSFLFHSYLPLTHRLFYGADGWRHLAIENQIVAGAPLSAADFAISSGVFLQRVGWGEISYSQFWGLSVIFSRVLSADLLAVIKWLLPVLWSVILPLLLFEIGRALERSKKESLFFAWLSFLPFAWQAGGSFSLPVNLGFLIWLLALLLIYNRVKNPQASQLVILGIFGVISVFGYALFCLLFWVIWAIAEVIILFRSPKAHKILAGAVYFLGTVILALFIPFLELISRFSLWIPGQNIFSGFKSIIGTFSGWYWATGPRTHDILAGNILFNQTPSYAFVNNFFVSWRWWVLVFCLLVFLGVARGFMVSLRAGRPHWLNNIFFLGIFLSYIISRYFLSGENILSRRLEVVLALGMVWFLVLALSDLGWGEKLLRAPVVEKITAPISRFSASGYRITFLAVVVAAFSFAASASYSSGPDTRAVSTDEFFAAQYVWVGEKENAAHCVLAGTYPLLALEAISAKEIVGGGFPMHPYFSQPERVNLLNSLSANPDPKVLDAVLELAGTNHCWVIMERVEDSNFRRNFTDVQMFGPLMAGKYVR